MTSYYLDIHVLQSVPPSNVNRDDTGAPKTALYGGVRRARVSSQAWKKAVRSSFAEFIDPEQRGERTLRVVELLINRLAEIAPHLSAEQARERAIAVVNALDLKTEKPRSKNNDDLIERTQYLVFYSKPQLDRLAALAATAEDKVSKREAKRAADSDHGIEVGLFGRMVADSRDLNVDAAVQVAHAISTHAVENEGDFYTAVDDYKLDEDDAGAGMMGTIEFNSSTLYRFATVDLTELRGNLTGDVPLTAEAAAAFVRGFITSMPTGKQNTFGNNTLPDGAVVQLRRGRSASYVGAFESAVTADGGYMGNSAEALASYATSLQEAFLEAPHASFVTLAGTQTAALASLGTQLPLTQLLEQVTTAVTDALDSEAAPS
ncbi:MAG: type I-E CRISPR-associated protein Cas7/Cse4/CasC [Arachnia sp.]